MANGIGSPQVQIPGMTYTGTSPISVNALTGVISFDTATTSLTGYVLKAGDTMTGALNITPSTDANALTLKAGGTSTSIKTLDVQDSSGTSWWYIRKGLLSDANIGLSGIFTTSGSTATSRTCMNFEMRSGYTGAEFTGVLGFDSSIAGTATYYTGDATVYGYRPSGNRGIGGFARGVTTGHNIGGMFLAGGGAVNYGVWGASTITKSSGTNVGVLAVAANASATSPGAIGLYATLYNSSTVPPNMTGIKTALLVDNQAFTDPIAIFRSNGVAFVSVEDAGQLLLGNRASTTSLGKLFNIPVDVATTDATLTVAESYTTATDTMYFIQSIITCQSSDRTKGGNIKIEGTFKNVAGVLTQIGVTTVVNNTVTDAGITSVFAVSGTAVQVKVTGLAATNIRFQNCFIINRVKY